MSDDYMQFNSDGTFSVVATTSVDITNIPILLKQEYSGTWKRVEKIYLHLQITNYTMSYDKSEEAKLPARIRDEFQKHVFGSWGRFY